MYKRQDVNCGVTHELQMPNGISGRQSGENCEFSLNNLQFNPSSFWLAPLGVLGNRSQDINVGAELTIDGYCKAGTYTGTMTVSAVSYTHLRFGFPTDGLAPFAGYSIRNSDDIR